MSLARRLMNAATSNEPVVEGVAFDNIEAAFTDDTIVIESALVELTESIYAIHEACDVADIIGEVRCIQEGADPTILMENILTDSVKKIKAALVKFWEKVKAWFKRVLEYFKSLTMKGEKFVKEFGEKIKKKAKNLQGFKYKVYDYDFTKGDALADKIQKDTYAAVNKFIGDCMTIDKNVETAKVGEGISKFINDSKEKAENAFSEDYIENLIKGMTSSASNTSELAEALRLEYHGGYDNKVDVTDFSNGPKVETMLEVVKTAKSTADKIKKDENLFDNNMKAIIAQLDKFKAEGDGADAKVALAKAYSAGAQKLLAIGKVGFSGKAAIYKEANNAFLAILRGIVGTGKVTESDDMEDEMDDDMDADVEIDVTDVKEACGSKKDVEEGYGGSKKCEDEPVGESLLEQALRLI